MKVIGRSIWDKTVFVMCDCHAELIQFTKTKDATCEFDILYYGIIRLQLRESTVTDSLLPVHLLKIL